MTSSTDTRLTSGQRLGRGLRYTAVGPVYVVRGLLGLGLSGAQSTAAWAGERYRRRGELAEQLSTELAVAQEVVANLPQALQKARTRRRRRPLLLAGVGAAVVAAGGLAFFVIRRSSRPEESSVRPPSVEVEPRP
ncbi:cell wall synthesis protein CwsA [Mycolicibacterium phlei]